MYITAPSLCGLLRGLERVPLVVLAIRHDDDDFLAHPLVVESTHSRHNRFADDGALAGDRPGAGTNQVGPCGSVVGSQWELDETGAREQDDANRIPPQLRDHIGYLQLGAVETSWFHVLGEHAARHVQYHHQLHTTLLDYLYLASPLRTRQGYDYQRYACKPEGKPNKAHSSTRAPAQTLDEYRIADAQHGSVPARLDPSREYHQHGEYCQSEQYLWGFKGHVKLMEAF